MHDWDDLRVFLATARSGSSRAGARRLRLNQSTVSRRVAQLEERLAVRLFDRQPGGLALTEAGTELLQLATEVEERMDTLNRRLHGRDEALGGVVRVSLPDFAVKPVVSHLGAFADLYPRIDVEVIVDNGLANLSHREADLVLRLATSPRPQLIGRRIASVRLAVYGSTEYLKGRQWPTDVTRLDWIRWDHPWHQAPMERWIEQNVPEDRVRGRINTSLAHAEIIASGLGVGFKPCYAGDADPRLERAGPPVDFGLALWLLTHDDLKNNARVRALMRFLGDALAKERLRFIGADDKPQRLYRAE
ncbi:MAG: DNA-binding transcriptional LysR family regulator [Myxococcota bacterium]|jgi:DNA-binding transcriptional LysR family regulator